VLRYILFGVLCCLVVFRLGAPFYYEGVTRVDLELLLEDDALPLNDVVKLLIRRGGKITKATGVVLAHPTFPSKEYTFILTVAAPLRAQNDEDKVECFVQSSGVPRLVRVRQWRVHPLAADNPRYDLCLLVCRKLPLEGVAFGGATDDWLGQRPWLLFASYGPRGHYSELFWGRRHEPAVELRFPYVGHVVLGPRFPAEEAFKPSVPGFCYHVARVTGAVDVIPVAGDEGGAYLQKIGETWYLRALHQSSPPFFDQDVRDRDYEASVMYAWLPPSRAALKRKEQALSSDEVARYRRRLLRGKRRRHLSCVDFFLRSRIEGTYVPWTWKEKKYEAGQLPRTLDEVQAVAIDANVAGWILLAASSLCSAERTVRIERWKERKYKQLLAKHKRKAERKEKRRRRKKKKSAPSEAA
jgi:hypothetical protein